MPLLLAVLFSAVLTFAVWFVVRTILELLEVRNSELKRFFRY